MTEGLHMPAIQVEHLCKTFRTKRKAPGLMASVRSLWRPDWQAVEACLPNWLCFRPTAPALAPPARGGLYPITLFDGTAKLLLFTVIPAAFVGAVPAEFVHRFDTALLAQILAAAAITVGLAVSMFYRGLRRYESGSAIQVRM